MTGFNPLATALDAATRLLGADQGAAFWAAHQIELAALLAIPAAIAAISIGQFVRHLRKAVMDIVEMERGDRFHIHID